VSDITPTEARRRAEAAVIVAADRAVDGIAQITIESRWPARVEEYPEWKALRRAVEDLRAARAKEIA
jgi:hypothetical protein